MGSCWITKNGIKVMVLTPQYFSYIVTSVVLVKETEVPGENHRPAASHWQTWLHNVVSSTPRLSGVRTHNVNDDRQ